MVGSTAGGILSAITHRPEFGLLGGAAGLGYGIHLHNKLREQGEFKKKMTPGYRGTMTGWGAFGSGLIPVVGTPLYQGIKRIKHGNLEDNEK